MKKVNFKRIIKQLGNAGVTQADIARATKRTNAGICRIAKGVTVDPAYSVGRVIVELHADNCGEKK